MRFKKGDKVRIINNESCHDFKIGGIVTIESINRPYYSAYSIDEETWWFADSECEPISNSITLKIKQL